MKKGFMVGGIVLLVILAFVFTFALTGKKEVTTGAKISEQQPEQQTEQHKKVEVNYNGIGNMQGNTENGGKQTFLGNDAILVNVEVDGNNKMLCFDINTQKLQIGCQKEGCLHSDSACAANHDLMYLQSYGNVYFGVPLGSSRREIWKVEQGEISCFYRSDNDVLGIWCYNEYLYYMTDFGIYRILMKEKDEAVQILERPVLYEYITFYGNSMYFCDENMLLYCADLDGKNEHRLLEEKVLSPQIYDDKIYYRSAEYDSKRQFEMKNTLFCVTLDGKKKEKVIDQIYQFCIADEGIYYTELPEEQETTLNYLSLKNGEQHKITDCHAGYMCVFEQTDWILFTKTDGELEEGEEGGKPTHLFCIKKDGTQCKRLEYPNMIGE